MKTILLAAGSGKRLGTLTKDTPKALIDINGQSLLERQIFALRKNEIDDIIVVTGPNRDKFKIPNVKYIHDIDYSNHDVLGTMMSVEEFMDDDVIISYTDIVFDEKIINSMKLSNQEINIAVEMDWEKAYVGRTEHPLEQAANVLINDKSVLKIGHQTETFGTFEKNNLGEFLGILKLSKSGIKIFKNEYSKLINNHKDNFHEAKSIQTGYITDMLQELINLQYLVNPVIINGKWCEIDTLQDLERAKTMFL